ncbi:MAG: hypothetical protein R3276_05365 [Marinobacter sp.]|nr:hypothetical protein [Marinobacter sp.]
MANLAGDHRGLIARVGTTKPLAPPVASLAGAVWQVSLLPVEFLLGDWLGAFDELWGGQIFRRCFLSIENPFGYATGSG